MANTLLTSTKILREALRILKNNLSFTNAVNKEYSKEFAVSGAKIGSTVNVRKPNRYTIRKGPTLNAQDTQEESVAITLTDQIGVDVNFSSKELTLSLDDFSERILQPAMATIANEIDLNGLAQYVNVFNQVGTPGTTPSTAADILAVGQRLDEMGAPRDQNRYLTVDPAANAALVNGMAGFYNPQADISRQFRKGQMGVNILGFKDVAMDQNINRHTVGNTTGSTPLVNGTIADGSTNVPSDGWALSITGVLKKGDVITFAGVYAVNPQSRVSTGSLMQFVVTADVDSDATGAATIPISPAIIASGAYQNVTNVPADNAVITVAGTASTEYPINIGCHKDAFTLATADLLLPRGVDFAAREVYDGISMRIVRQYDINTDNFPCRIDVLYGWKTIYPELAVRLIG